MIRYFYRPDRWQKEIERSVPAGYFRFSIKFLTRMPLTNLSLSYHHK